MRVLRFSRYLTEFGWRPIVVCVDGGASHEPRDPQLLPEVPPDVLIERVRCLEPDNYSDSWDVPREKVVRNLFKLFDKALFPDDRAFWVRPVVQCVQRIVGKYRPEVLWATAQPWSTLVAGMRCKQATGLPLVLDFRDDWTTSNSDFRKTKYLEREKRLEQKVLKSADAVVSVTPHIVEALRKRRPATLGPEQFHYIPNGFDPDHFPTATKQSMSENQTFMILHAGGLYEKRPVTPLLEFLRAWFDQHPERREKVKVVLAGRTTAAVDKEIQDSGLEDIIEKLGFVSHVEIRKLMQQSAVNLLMIERVKSAAWLFTGKVFEYIGARRPILMLGPDPSPLADLLKETGLGHIADYEQPSRTAEMLEEIYRAETVALTPAQCEKIQEYNARNQSGVLAEIFESLAQR